MSDPDQEIAVIKGRLEKLETQMSYLLRNLGISEQDAPAGGASARVMELVRAGDTIAAIKAFREETGASLKDAKNFVESLAE